ncbi:hypothetical protein BDY21DRAFT_140216 [Lineolata rhizophorae]|uniref:Uncharacterized protein n=1 Tax=Lineolata rhizophorae TaxID=578093 RepID=A0A6A6PB35_9PEZI|nr:hypothetical protein BDY21DRAFT_140216 [Lineolata rhizophorae]
MCSPRSAGTTRGPEPSLAARETGVSSLLVRHARREAHSQTAREACREGRSIHQALDETGAPLSPPPPFVSADRHSAPRKLHATYVPTSSPPCPGPELVHPIRGRHLAIRASRLNKDPASHGRRAGALWSNQRAKNKNKINKNKNKQGRGKLGLELVLLSALSVSPSSRSERCPEAQLQSLQAPRRGGGGKKGSVES